MIAEERLEKEDDVCCALSVSVDDLFHFWSSVKKQGQGRGSMVQDLIGHPAVMCLQNSMRLRWEPTPNPVLFHSV